MGEVGEVGEVGEAEEASRVDGPRGSLLFGDETLTGWVTGSLCICPSVSFDSFRSEAQ